MTNWKNRYSIIKVGDMVKCVSQKRLGTENNVKGAGWKEGHIFKIKKITNVGSWTKLRILWESNNKLGVLENFVELQ